MVFNDKNKELLPIELSNGGMINFLKSLKLQDALLMFDDDLSERDLGDISNFLKNDIYGAGQIVMNYMLGLSNNCPDGYIKHFHGLHKCHTSDSKSDPIAGCEGTDLNFVKLMGKLPFNVSHKSFGVYQDNTYFRKFIQFFGIGFLPKLWKKLINDNSLSVDDIEDNIDEYIDALSDEILEFSYDNKITKHESCNHGFLNNPKINTLLDSTWGYDFDVLTLSSKEFDEYIDRNINSKEKIGQFIELFEDFYSLLIPFSYTTTRISIIDRNSPLWDFYKYDNISCKYRLVSLSLADSGWDLYADKFSSPQNVEILLSKISCMSEYISEN